MDRKVSELKGALYRIVVCYIKYMTLCLISSNRLYAANKFSGMA